MKTRTLKANLILVLVVLIITGSSAGASDTEIFFQAVKSGDYAEVKRLTEAGVDINAQDNEELTALMYSSLKGYPEIVKLLIEAGAKEF